MVGPAPSSGCLVVQHGSTSSWVTWNAPLLGSKWSKSTVKMTKLAPCDYHLPSGVERPCQFHPIVNHYSWTGVGKCPSLGILNITFKYLLETISPIFGWCSIGTFTNPCFLQTFKSKLAASGDVCFFQSGNLFSACCFSMFPLWQCFPLFFCSIWQCVPICSMFFFPNDVPVRQLQTHGFPLGFETFWSMAPFPIRPGARFSPHRGPSLRAGDARHSSATTAPKPGAPVKKRGKNGVPMCRFRQKPGWWSYIYFLWLNCSSTFQAIFSVFALAYFQ